MERELELFISNHNITPESENGRSYVFDCPSCGGKRKLYIEKETGRSICFKAADSSCPKSGSPVYALSLITGLHASDISKELFDHDTVLKETISFDQPNKTQSSDELQPATGADLPLDFTPIYDPSSIDGVLYLESRGITRDLMIKYGLMYSPIMRRVIFPIVMNGKLYGWQGRAIDKVDKGFRMYNMPGRWKTKTLMFYSNLEKSEYAILAEGPISALKFAKAGGFVASMGKEIDDAQLDLIRSSSAKRIYLALDRDAKDKVQLIASKMRDPRLGEMECYMIEIPSHRDDFGDCTYEECEQAFKEAQPVNPNDLHINIEAKSLIRTKLR